MARVKQFVEAAFSAVMLDFSTRSYEENIVEMQEAVALAKTTGATVEGEIGHVGKADKSAFEGSGDSVLTDPDTAEGFVRRTGIDALAISIGNAHGQYAKLPRFDFDLLTRLNQTVSVPLVLHGGSGTPPEDIQKAIRLGIAKINVATEIMVAYRTALLREWDREKPQWLPVTTSIAAQAIRPVMEKWLRLSGAAGKA